jgi:hypothetical protein
MTDYNDIEFFAGEDIDITVPITMNGVALNVDDATLTWKMYHILTGIALVKDNADFGGVTINNDNESITLSFVKADTEDLIPLTYFHEIRIAKSGAENVLIPQGRLTLKQSYTLIEPEGGEA